MPSMGTQKRVLRASCDSCHQSKVKCVPTAAGCQRCLRLNTLCIHSPPGRSGRAPATTATQGNHSRAPGKRHVFRATSSMRESDDNDDHQNPQVSSSTADFPTDAAMAVHPSPDQNEPADSMLSNWFSLSAPPMGPLYSSDHTSLLPDSSKPFSPTFAMSSLLPTATSDFLTGDHSSQYTPTTHPSLGPHLGHLAFTSDVQQSLACACFQTIVRALEKIQQANMTVLSVDVALSQNKEALVHICNALKCTSPHDSTTRLLMLVLLRKNLHLYHTLYQSRLRIRKDKDRNNSPSPFSSPSPWSSLNSSLHQPSQQRDLNSERSSQSSTARLTLGSYQLDLADESSLTKQILLLDVNKVPRLLERLDRRACGLTERMDWI